MELNDSIAARKSFRRRLAGGMLEASAVWHGQLKIWHTLIIETDDYHFSVRPAKYAL